MTQSTEVLGAAPDGPAGVEAALAEILAAVLDTTDVAPDAHFFHDLGANSLSMAHFCARVRKRADVPSVSIKDVYRHPTIRELAAASAPSASVDDAHPEAAVPAASAAVTAPAATTRSSTVATSPHAAHPVPPLRGSGEAPVREPTTTGPTPSSVDSRAGSRRHLACGAAQAAVFLLYTGLAALGGALGYRWISEASGLVEIYLRAAAVGGAALLLVCAVPVAAKWLLVGRWKEQEFPVWGAAYFRLWLVKSLLHANPVVLFVGNPLYVLYLRALGARIGPGVTILSRTVPVCTDLITIGAGTVIRKDCHFLGYRVVGGIVQTGPVTLGRDVVVGEMTTLDIGSAMGDGAQLGHTSALHTGTAVPAGQHWHGSPAEPTGVDYARVPPAECGRGRRTAYGTVTLLQLLLLYLPLTFGGSAVLAAQAPVLHSLLTFETSSVSFPGTYLIALAYSLVVFGGLMLLGLAVELTVPKLLGRFVRPDRVYPLYGMHYSLHRAITRLTNLKIYLWWYGDSSYIVGHLRRVGWDLTNVEQTGSNFGTGVQHETPFHVQVGRGTMVADGLSVMNAEFSSTSFRVTPTVIGAHSFLGNLIAYPAGGRTGENVLLATKVLVPLDGPVRENVGLLGSPSFEIPRTVDRDSRFDHLRSGEELRRRLTAKNHYNARSMALWLLLRWLSLALLFIVMLVVADVPGRVGDWMVALLPALTVVVSTAYFLGLERVILRRGPLQPQLCSIYDPYFWWHERLWKMPDRHLALFNGTPMKSVIWRVLGVRIGRRVFDDGCAITERTLAEIGDDCSLNAATKLQSHSQEDGTFKSDHIRLGAGVTLGVNAFVHYGTTLGAGAQLAADCFLMKGEQVPDGARWVGNPAGEAPEDWDDTLNAAAAVPALEGARR